MTARWLTLNAAADRLSEAWGVDVSMDQVIALGRHDVLIVRFQHGYHSVSEESVTAYLSAPERPGRDADEVAEHADRTEWRGGPDLPDFIEDEYQRGKDT
jgi:hypothetical protein